MLKATHSTGQKLHVTHANQMHIKKTKKLIKHKNINKKEKKHFQKSVG